MVLKGSENIATEKVEERFEKVSTDIFYYVQLGLIKPGDVCVYVKYLELYNPNYGYAFPTLYKMQDWLNLSRSSLISCNKRLVNAGLLRQSKYKANNNVYIPLQPLNKQQLAEVVPDEVEKLKSRQNQIYGGEEADHVRRRLAINHNNKD